MAVQPSDHSPDKLTAVTTQTPRRPGVTPRILLLCIPLVIVNNYWVMQTETIRYAGFPTTISLYYNVVFILLTMVFVNLVVSRLAPRWSLSHGELAVAYTILCLASSTCGHDAIQVLTPILTHPFRFADDANQWMTQFGDYLPRWAMMSDPTSLKNLYEGGSTLYAEGNWNTWVRPVAWWVAFITALYLVTLCINSLFRRRWVESERLTYPIIQLPLEMTRPGSRIFWNKYMWLAFALALTLDVLNGLKMFYPAVPGIPVKVASIPQFNIGAQVVDRPWNAIQNLGSVYVSFYPFAIGLGLLLPTELAFSCWFWYFFWRAEMVAASAFGWTSIAGFPFVNEQTFAGYLALGGFAIWTSRGYLRQVLRAAVRLEGDPEGRREALPHAASLVLGLAGFAFLVGFTMRAGATLWYAVSFFVIHFGLGFAVTRIRAEMGLPAHDLHHAGPGQVLYRVLGGFLIPKPSQTVGQMYYWFNRAYRSYASPHQAEGFKLAERTGTSVRALFPVMAFAVALGSLASFWAILHLGYQDGFAAKVAEPKVSLIFGREPYDELVAHLNAPERPSLPAVWAMVVGFVTVFGLMHLKTHVLWWPFHPVGFAVSASWAMQHLWCPMFLAWGAKWTLTRYGGHSAFRHAVPFAFGLILGDLIGGSFWTIYGIAKHVATYSIWV